MNETTSPETQIVGRHPKHDSDVTTPCEAAPACDAAPDDPVDRRLERRAALRDRHAQGVTRLMEERADLRGVLPLADLVDDAVRWTA